MITFRYHIVSIVSVFLALAVGIALGGGPLKGEVDNTLVNQVKADRQTRSQLRAEIAGLRSGDTFNDQFATTAAPGLVGTGEQLADGVEHAGVGGQVGPRSAADRLLVHPHQPVNPLHSAGFCHGFAGPRR